jgi:hypothetical protein
MIWLYVPPVILIVALAGLIVILGKKSGEMKKISVLQSNRENVSGEKISWKNRLNSIGKKILHLLEKILEGSKLAFKKTEQIFSVWVAKLRARRRGKSVESIIEEERKGDEELRIIQEIEKTEQISANISENQENIRYVGNEVIARRKIEIEPLPIPKKEPLPEDRVREAALIYRIAENPKDLEAYRDIGDYYMGIGNIKDAKESFKMVLKLRPRDLKAKSSLREIEMKMRLGS